MQGFPRQNRLLNAADFQRVFSDSRRSADRFFTILYSPCPGGQPRLGFAVSRQRVRLAVQRNRLRRVVRDSFRKRRPTLPAVDLVVMARDAATTAANVALFASLDRHWQAVEQGALEPPANPRKPTS